MSHRWVVCSRYDWLLKSELMQQNPRLKSKIRADCKKLLKYIKKRDKNMLQSWTNAAAVQNCKRTTLKVVIAITYSLFNKNTINFTE